MHFVQIPDCLTVSAFIIKRFSAAGAFVRRFIKPSAPPSSKNPAALQPSSSRRWANRRGHRQTKASTGVRPVDDGLTQPQQRGQRHVMGSGRHEVM
jgi:hypothetical protein